MDTAWAHASEIAAAVSDSRTSATAVVGGALARIAKHDRALNAFTAVTEERALAKAAARARFASGSSISFVTPSAAATRASAVCAGADAPARK